MTMQRTCRAISLALAFAVLTTGLGAQTAQRFSIQGSGLYAGLYGEAFDQIKDGFGGELQLRFTPGVWSFGAGVQHTQHGVSDDVSDVFSGVNLTGAFFEPRYVIDVGSSSYAPYISGRFALSRMKFKLQDDVLPPGFEHDLSEPTGPTINGGGGFLIRMGSRANLDIGVTFGYTNFNDVRLRIRNAQDVEVVDETIEVGSGLNAVVRLGFAVGLGG